MSSTQRQAPWRQAQLPKPLEVQQQAAAAPLSWVSALLMQSSLLLALRVLRVVLSSPSSSKGPSALAASSSRVRSHPLKTMTQQQKQAQTHRRRRVPSCWPALLHEPASEHGPQARLLRLQMLRRARHKAHQQQQQEVQVLVILLLLS